MNDVLPEHFARSASMVERFVTRACPIAAPIGAAALGGVGGYLAGEALTPEGHEVFGVALETIIGAGAGVMGACAGLVIGVRLAIGVHRA